MYCYIELSEFPPAEGAVWHVVQVVAVRRVYRYPVPRGQTDRHGHRGLSVRFIRYILLKRSLESVARISLYYRLQTLADSEGVDRSRYNFQRMFPA